MDIKITSVNENEIQNKKQNTEIEQNGIELRLGDIIEVQSPTNLDYHENTYYIEYIDESIIKLLNVSSLKKQTLTLSENGKLNDESILSIYLLDRDENEGYALQNNLVPHTWVDIHIGGDTPKIITGEITNLEEDMIEITTFPELITFYIDFEYKGILEPFKKFFIRERPSSAPTNLKAVEEGEMCEIPFDSKATIEYTETGESIITIPENAMADKDIRETLNSMYLDANDIIYGEELEEIQLLVELPESEKRYGIEIQANDLLDELLSTIPNSKRSKSVMDNIHNLIERFKQLRNKFSKFDENNNVVGPIQLGPLHKPLIERIRNLDTKLQWLVPVVAQKRKLYMESDEDETYKDIIPTNLARELTSQEQLFDEYKDGSSANAHNNSMNKHSQLYSSMDKYNNPFVSESIQNDSLVNQQEVLTNIDAIVNNLGNFYSTVSKTEKKTRFMSQTKHVIQRYNLGLKKKESKVMKSGRTVYFNNNMTPNDTMTIKSLIMLPEPVMKFSQVELPGTNILKRVNIHENNSHVSLFRLLRKHTDISTHIVDNLEKEIDYEGMDENEDNINFLTSIKEYVLDEELENEPDKLNKFLNVVVPKTRSIIRLIRKYIKDKLSFIEIVKELEPFMVYHEDITYQQYNEIRFFIKEKIKEFNIEYLKKLKEFNALRDIRTNVSAKMNDIENVLFNQRELLEMFKDGYKLKDVDFSKIANSEVLAKLIKMDQNTLFSDLITVMTMKNLTSPNNLLDAFEPAKLDDMTNIEKIKPKDCVRRYLAKRYTNIKDLKSDNNKDEVYYDKELDDTPYSILDKYANEKKTMSVSTYLEFLTETLISNHNVEPNYAKELAMTLIEGKKQVKDGEYAVLTLQPVLSPDIDHDKLTEKEKKEIELEAKTREKKGYYYRVKDQWVHDSNIDSEAFIDTNTLFCNIREDCYKSQSNNVCESKKTTQHRLEDLTKSRMVKEFENRITMSLEQLEEVVKKRLTDDFKKIHNETMLREIRMTKYNNYVYELGKMTITEEIITSPYIKLRDLILGQDDFSKKQEDICEFVKRFCREPMIDELKEDMHWLYCKDTNTKLLPNSLYKLAQAFVLHSSEGYTRFLNDLCENSQGVLSDDRDSIVDKHSGYILRKRDFITEDEYTEEGMRFITHSVIEKDLDTKLTELFSDTKLNKTILFENDLNKMIYNITDSICSNIGIPTDSIEDFVVRMTNEIMNKNIQSPESYKENAKKMEKRDVRPIPYEIYKNRFMFWIIASCILISIQTAMPSFRSKKTFPGCLRSFSGYPLSGGVEDITGIEYIACVMFKMTNPSDRNAPKTKTAIEPWNAIERVKSRDYIKKIRETIDKFFIPVRNDIMDMYARKREYLILHPNEVIPEEHSIDKWHSFLPPVVKFSMGSLIPVSSDFEKDLFEMVMKGHTDQRKYLNIIKTKGIYYGYGIIELINKIIKKIDPILKTSSKEPFLENACCAESSISRPMDYFIENDNTIHNYIQISDNIYELLYEFRKLSKPSLLYHKEITRMKYSVSQDISDISEHDLYAAFIHYCHFDKELPIPDDLLAIISEKPIGYPIKSSLVDKIEFLKQNGKQFKLEDLQQLMTIIRNNNRITVNPALKYTQVDGLLELLDKFDTRDSKIIESGFRQKLRNVLTSYKPNAMIAEERDELTKMKNYLASANQTMFYSIVKFLDKHGNLSDSRYEKMQDFLLDITDTNLSSRDAMYTMTTFIQNSIYSMSKIFPQMILTETIFETIPEHWQLSGSHIINLKKVVSDFWSNIKEFHGDTVLSLLLNEVQTRLNDLFLLINEFPVYSPIEKNNHIFYSIFDNESINMIYIYFWYSCLHEYVVCANDPELLRTDIEENKSQYKTEISNMKNEADQLSAIEEKNEEEFDYGQEIDIRIGNKEELQTRVAKLLITFLDIEQENKSVVLSYSEISKKIRKSKSKEKEKLVKDLGRLANDARAIEEQFKQYKMGKWNVGLQKGLFKYDPKTYDREVMENSIEEYKDNGMEVDELENAQNLEISNEYDNEGLNIQQFGEDYQDGDFYGEYKNDFGDW